METLINILLFVFTGVVCVWWWDYFHQDKNERNIAGTLIIYKQDGEAYLFLDTELKPEKLAKYKEVVFKVETQNPQAPL